MRVCSIARVNLLQFMMSLPLADKCVSLYGSSEMNIRLTCHLVSKGMFEMNTRFSAGAWRDVRRGELGDEIISCTSLSLTLV